MKQILSFIAVILLFSCSNHKTKIYQWRGENRTGVYSETNLIKQWPENGPEEIWFAEGIGNGYGSPTVTESELFITGENDSLAWLFCYDLSGNLIWKKQYGKEWAKHYPGSRSAPTVVDDLVYAGTGAVIAADNMLYYYNWGGELSLINCENGKLQKQSVFKIARGTKEHFSHPVIKNGILYQRRGNSLMAFDIRAKG